MNDTWQIALPDPESTARLGAALARALMHHRPGAVLLYGDLGAGKTAFVRALVSALPGGDKAEVSSPSFTICNIYCTQPLVHHYDLYRLPLGQPEESLAESLDDENVVTIIEWPEHLSLRDMPQDGLVLRLSAGANANARDAELFALGRIGESCLQLLRAICDSRRCSVQPSKHR